MNRFEWQRLAKRSLIDAKTLLDEHRGLPHTIQDPWFDSFQIKLIGENDPLARAALEVYRRFPGRTPARIFGRTFGGVTVDEVYFYPLPTPAPTP